MIMRTIDLFADLRESDSSQASKQCKKRSRILNLTRLLAAYISWARMFQLTFVSVNLGSLILNAGDHFDYRDCRNNVQDFSEIHGSLSET